MNRLAATDSREMYLVRTCRSEATLVGVLLLVFALVGSEGQAAVINYGIVSNGVEVEFGFGEGVYTNQWIAGNGDQLGDPFAPPPVTPLPPLTATFEGNDTFTVNLSAPPGMHFEVVDPGIGDILQFSVDIYAVMPTTSGSGTLDSLTFHDPVGMPPSPDWGVFRFESFNDALRMRLNASVTAPFEFSGVSFTFTTPADMAVPYVDELLGYGVSFRAESEAPPFFEDPGQWVFLVPDDQGNSAIPEPATLALLGIGLAAAARRRRR